MSYVLKEAVLQLRNSRQKLEFEILQLVKEFEITTGTTVEGIVVWDRDVTKHSDPHPMFVKKIDVKFKI